MYTNLSSLPPSHIVSLRNYRIREQDVREHRLSASELEKLMEEQAVKNAEERKERGERSKKRFEEQRQKELDDVCLRPELCILVSFDF